MTLSTLGQKKIDTELAKKSNIKTIFDSFGIFYHDSKAWNVFSRVQM